MSQKNGDQTTFAFDDEMSEIEEIGIPSKVETLELQAAQSMSHIVMTRKSKALRDTLSTHEAIVVLHKEQTAAAKMGFDSIFKVDQNFDL